MTSLDESKKRKDLQSVEHGQTRNVAQRVSLSPGALKQKQQEDLSSLSLLELMFRLNDNDVAVVEGTLIEMNSRFNLTDQSKACHKKNVIGSIGGPLVIVSIMAKHDNHIGIQSQGCSALASLAGHSSKILTNIGNVRGIRAVVAAMEKFPSDSDLQEGAFGALGILLKDPKQLDLFYKIDGIVKLIKIMNKNTDNASIQKQACLIIEEIAQATGDFDAIAEAGAITSIVTALKANPCNAPMQIQGWNTLTKLHDYDEGLMKDIVEAGGIRVISRALEKNVGNPGMLKHLGQTLQRIGNAIADGIISK